MDEKLLGRWADLQERISEYGASVVAFSGGVDSSLLLLAAIGGLGREKVVAATASSATLTQEERQRARQIAEDLEVPHEILEAPEFSEPSFVENGPERCYYCKKARFSALLKWGKAAGYPVIIEGTHSEDLNDYRPGLRAIKELGESIKSPFAELGWTKAEIRQMSKELGLATWDLPSAACLASRIAYGISLNEANLKQAEQAETFLKEWIKGPLRVRHHGNWARIEVEPKEWQLLTDEKVAAKIATTLKELGFDYVTLDLSGLKSGSMNVGLK